MRVSRMTGQHWVALAAATGLVYCGICAVFSVQHVGVSGCALLVLVWLVVSQLVRSYFVDERIDAENKTVFVTGCDSGFGNRLAKRLDSIGFQVFAGCLIPGGNGAEDLRQTCSGRLKVLPLDVTSDDSVSRALQFVKENIGPNTLWAVVNNAGLSKGSSFDFSTIDHFKGTMDVNALGPVRVSKAFLPLLKKSRGRIVNVASLQGRVPVPQICPYTMSKHAVVAFTECLSLEMIPWGVRVISIEPGPFKTPIMDAGNNVRRMKAEREEIDESISSSYGEDYFKQIEKVAVTAGKISSSNIEVVIDAMEAAITKVQPEHVYKPRGTLIMQVATTLYEIVPFSIQIKLFLLVSKFLHYPVPRDVKI